MAEIFRSGTEYIWSQLTELRGEVNGATPCGIYFTSNPNEVPAVNEFHEAILVPASGHTLSDGNAIWVTQLVGPATIDPEIVLTEGDYQVFVLVEVGPEKIIRRPGTLTVL